MPPLLSRAKHSTRQLTSHLTVPKSRRPRFELTLRILDLNNIPLTAGTAHVKWHLPLSNAAEHRGRTDKAAISPSSHLASWAYVKVLPVRMTVDKQGMLNSCEVHFEVIQEFTYDDKNGGRDGKGGAAAAAEEEEEEEGEEEEAEAESTGVRRERESISEESEKARIKTDSNEHLDDDRQETITTPTPTHTPTTDDTNTFNQDSDPSSTLNTPQTDDSSSSHHRHRTDHHHHHHRIHPTTRRRRKSFIFSDSMRPKSRELKRPSTAQTTDRESSISNPSTTNGQLDADANTATGSASIKSDKSLLGRVKLNLAEYVNEGREDEGVVRRYLMQDSKINSTLRIGIAMRLVEGENNFNTPPLKSSSVFGGITGVIAEQNEPDETGRLLSATAHTINTTTTTTTTTSPTSGRTTNNNGHGKLTPSISAPSSALAREARDLQDMYRRTLAASYICRQDELPPDELIEDIFAGGDGFKGGWDTFMTSRMGKSNGAITASNSSGLAASSGHPGTHTHNGHGRNNHDDDDVNNNNDDDDDADANDLYDHPSHHHADDNAPVSGYTLYRRHNNGSHPSSSSSSSSSSAAARGHARIDSNPTLNGAGPESSDRFNIPKRHPSVMKHRTRRSFDISLAKKKERERERERENIGGTTMRWKGEVSEFDIRGDLKSWSIGSNAGVSLMR